jgi:hypothetical protein
MWVFSPCFTRNIRGGRRRRHPRYDSACCCVSLAFIHSFIPPCNYDAQCNLRFCCMCLQTADFFACTLFFHADSLSGLHCNFIILDETLMYVWEIALHSDEYLMKWRSCDVHQRWAEHMMLQSDIVQSACACNRAWCSDRSVARSWKVLPLMWWLKFEPKTHSPISSKYFSASNLHQHRDDIKVYREEQIYTESCYKKRDLGAFAYTCWWSSLLLLLLLIHRALAFCLSSTSKLCHLYQLFSDCSFGLFLVFW